jgi:hypothetical protein
MQREGEAKQGAALQCKGEAQHRLTARSEGGAKHLVAARGKCDAKQCKGEAQHRLTARSEGGAKHLVAARGKCDAKYRKARQRFEMKCGLKILVFFFFVTLLPTGIVAANPCLNSICGGQDSEPTTVEAIVVLAEEKQTVAGESVLNSPTTKGLRGTPSASPVFCNPALAPRGSWLDTRCSILDIRCSILDTRGQDARDTIEQCPRLEAGFRDLTSMTINAAYKYMRMDLYTAYEISNTWCVVVSSNREGLADLPGPSFIFATEDTENIFRHRLTRINTVLFLDADFADYA